MARLDINGIKESLRSVLNTENTTTSSDDLSTSMVNRVQKILKVNPEVIPIQASFYPAVTIFIDNKDIDFSTIAAGSQVTAKRKCTLSVNIVGFVWNDIFVQDDEDPADEDLENLMENIELILRSHPTIQSKVSWQKPSGVSYHSFKPSEETHMRAGILTLQAEAFY